MGLALRRGDISDTEDFTRFLEKIKAAMPQKEWFYLDPPDIVRKAMADGTMEL